MVKLALEGIKSSSSVDYADYVERLSTSNSRALRQLNFILKVLLNINAAATKVALRANSVILSRRLLRLMGVIFNNAKNDLYKVLSKDGLVNHLKQFGRRVNNDVANSNDLLSYDDNSSDASTIASESDDNEADVFVNNFGIQNLMLNLVAKGDLAGLKNLRKSLLSAIGYFAPVSYVSYILSPEFKSKIDNTDKLAIFHIDKAKNVKFFQDIVSALFGYIFSDPNSDVIDGTSRKDASKHSGGFLNSSRDDKNKGMSLFGVVNSILRAKAATGDSTNEAVALSNQYHEILTALVMNAMKLDEVEKGNYIGGASFSDDAKKHGDDLNLVKDKDMFANSKFVSLNELRDYRSRHSLFGNRTRSTDSDSISGKHFTELFADSDLSLKKLFDLIFDSRSFSSRFVNKFKSLLDKDLLRPVRSLVMNLVSWTLETRNAFKSIGKQFYDDLKNSLLYVDNEKYCQGLSKLKVDNFKNLLCAAHGDMANLNQLIDYNKASMREGKINSSLTLERLFDDRTSFAQYFYDNNALFGVYYPYTGDDLRNFYNKLSDEEIKNPEIDLKSDLNNNLSPEFNLNNNNLDLSSFYSKSPNLNLNYKFNNNNVEKGVNSYSFGGKLNNSFLTNNNRIRTNFINRENIDYYLEHEKDEFRKAVKHNFLCEYNLSSYLNIPDDHKYVLAPTVWHNRNKGANFGNIFDAHVWLAADRKSVV